jgi:glycosyltransferase involved in cell wall biosynthesis
MSYPSPDGQILLARDRGLSAGLMKFLFPWVRGRVGSFLLYRVVLPNADHTFVQSNQMKADLVQRGIHPERMTPVPMGVDQVIFGKLDILPVDDRCLAGKRVIVYLGTLDRPRKIEILFEMLVIIKRQFPNAILVLVGDTQDKIHQCWLKMKATKAGVGDHVLWTGWLPMHEGWRYVRAAELGLSPFPRGYLLDSASPTKVSEYLALGVPVVCNNNPDQEQLISQSGAGICVPYSAEDFASAAIRILSLSKEKRNELGEKGKEYVSYYRNYRLIGNNLADSYRDLLC